MIAIGQRPASEDPYDLLAVFRVLCDRVPEAYVESVKTSDEAARDRLVKLMHATSGDLPVPSVDIANEEREKVERWGGVILSARLRGSDEGLIAFIGPRNLMIRGDGHDVPDDAIHDIVSSLRQIGYGEVRLQ